MADTTKIECFENAIIDINDMTITEYKDDCINSYSISEILKRWNGVVGIKVLIEHVVPLVPDRS